MALNLAVLNLEPPGAFSFSLSLSFTRSLGRATCSSSSIPSRPTGEYPPFFGLGMVTGVSMTRVRRWRAVAWT